MIRFLSFYLQQNYIHENGKVLNFIERYLQEKKISEKKKSVKVVLSDVVTSF